MLSVHSHLAVCSTRLEEAAQEEQDWDMKPSQSEPALATSAQQAAQPGGGGVSSPASPP